MAYPKYAVDLRQTRNFSAGDASVTEASTSQQNCIIGPGLPVTSEVAPHVWTGGDMSTLWVPHTATAKAVVAAGFLYDPDQDIIYSRMNALQRQGGYTWAYDVTAPSGNMILDCEPIYITAHKTMWLIELWKGQYGIQTGCEIGLYNHPHALTANSSKRELWYACANNSEMNLLTLSFRLYRNGKEVFHRNPESNWWLNGFKWGVFTPQPSDLTMDVAIDFHPASEDMYPQFVSALQNLRYHFTTSGRTVRFRFDRPRTPQPGTRAVLGDQVQKNNKLLVELYSALKQELGLSSNDPNGFKLPHQEPIEPTLRSAAKTHLPPPPLRKAVKPVREAVRKAVARGAHVVQDDVGERFAAHDVFAFFHNKVWHNTAEPSKMR